MKNLSSKQKIVFIITVIFFCTSVAAKIKNFSIIMKAINKKRNIIEQKVEEDAIKYKSNTNVTVSPNKNLQNKEEIKNRLVELSNTLDEATDYLKNNIDNKDKKEEISVLIGDCISALNSIENALTKIKDEKENINEIKSIKKLKSKFNELNQAFQNGNLDKCKEILK